MLDAEAAATTELPADAEVIDATGKVVMPGLVDLHCHTAIERGGHTESLELERALNDFWYPVMRNLDPDTVYRCARHMYAEQLCSGTTTVNDMFRHLDACAAAADELGIRGDAERARRHRRARARLAGRQSRRVPNGSTVLRLAGSASGSGSSGCRSPPRSCSTVRARSSPRPAPASTSISASRSVRSSSPSASSANDRSRSPATSACSGPGASPHTASG